jgi:hypothetical protein
MTRRNPVLPLSFALAALFSTVVAATATACHDDSTPPSSQPEVITETGFLDVCEATADCEGTLACVCGRCTSSCDNPATCGDRAVCATVLPASSCLGGLTACLPGCTEDSDCGPGDLCTGDSCVAERFIGGRPITGLSCDELDCDDGDSCTDDTCLALPTKYVFVTDQSASLQCTDSENRRFVALNAAVDGLMGLPNTEIGLVGFSSWSRVVPFTRDRAELGSVLDPGAGLGPATDYQGALSSARQLIEDDLLAMSVNDARRTQYVVMFMSDGVPEPRCNAGCEDDITLCTDGLDNDGDGDIDAVDGDCASIEDNTLHPDNLYGICNTMEAIPDDVYIAYEGSCPEYNSDAQILGAVDAIIALEQPYQVRGINLHTSLLYSPTDVVDAICPGSAQLLGGNHDTAAALLTAMAEAGGGTFLDINLVEGSSDFIPLEMGDEFVECANTPVQGVCEGN